MKTIYVRICADNKFGYDIVSANMYKEYPEYGVAITKTNLHGDYYRITDIKSGLHCNRLFKKLKNAKSFMEHTEEANFKNWYDAVQKARTTERYSKLILKVR